MEPEPAELEENLLRGRRSRDLTVFIYLWKVG